MQGTEGTAQGFLGPTHLPSQAHPKHRAWEAPKHPCPGPASLVLGQQRGSEVQAMAGEAAGLRLVPHDFH